MTTTHQSAEGEVQAEIALDDERRLTKFHCPNCGRYTSNVTAEEYGELQGKDSWFPYYEWHVMGDCKIHGRLEIKDHDGEDGCDCWSVHDADCWWHDPAPSPAGKEDV